MISVRKVLAALALALLATAALGSSQGPLTCADAASADCTAAAKACITSDDRATCLAVFGTITLATFDYGFSIPVGATAITYEVLIEGCHFTAAPDIDVSLTTDGSTCTGTPVVVPFTSACFTDGNYTSGVTAFGTTLDPATDINTSTFGACFGTSDTVNTAAFDTVRMTINYTLGGHRFYQSRGPDHRDGRRDKRFS